MIAVRRLSLPLLLSLLSACGGSDAPSAEEPTSAPPESAPQTEPEPAPEAEPAPETEPPPENADTCSADAQHCCQADGTVVRPGGCQPVYRDGDVPDVHRGPDGFCVPDEEPCLVRCLPADAEIATPNGPVPIHSLVVGDVIYTEDGAGRRVEAPVTRVGRVPLLGTHRLVAARLSDGRVVRGSAPHPVHDGRELGSLSPGDVLDGAAIVGIDTRAYDGEATHDVLPAGSSGVYWSDGVRMRSTLTR